MIQFILVVAGYLFLVNRYLDSGVAPVGKRLQKNLIRVPERTIEAVVLFGSMVYPMTACVKARQSDWKPYESRGAMAVIAGVGIGMMSNVD
ncbi:unnamed protein product [Ectocarpus sp. 6 AP-2014]